MSLLKKSVIVPPSENTRHIPTGSTHIIIWHFCPTHGGRGIFGVYVHTYLHVL